MYHHNHHENAHDNVCHDHGAKPTVLNLRRIAASNRNFRTAIWTGSYMQITTMSLNRGECIGMEIHEDADQLIVVESGIALVEMGGSCHSYGINTHIGEGGAVIVPAGTPHNITNIGNMPLKLYSVYAPPQHRKDTIHHTKQYAEEYEG